jgi:CRP-like cAMP-binding protein
MTEHVVNALRNSDFFNPFSTEELVEISGICTLRHFKENEIVFSESQDAKDFFLIHKGSVNLIFSSKKIIKVGPSQLFGDWAIVNDTVRLATAVAKENLEVLALDGLKLKTPEYFSPVIALKIIMQIAKSLVERLQSQSQISSQILIETGETEKTEFKSTLMKNLATGKKDTAIEMAVVKTIAAFLNTNGGVLFIGVSDDRNILGIDHDEFNSEDKLLQHLTHIVTSKLGVNAILDIHPVIISLRGKRVVRIDVEPSFEPIFVKDGAQNELFFVRVGVTTLSYGIRDAIEYIKHRF